MERYKERDLWVGCSSAGSGVEAGGRREGGADRDGQNQTKGPDFKVALKILLKRSVDKRMGSGDSSVVRASNS